MATFEKHYIGKGTQVEGIDIVKVVIPVEGIEGAMFDKLGVKYYSFEVSRLKQADKFGRTHTVYYQTKVSSNIPPQDEEPAKQKKEGKKKSKKKDKVEDDLPF